MSGCNVPPGSRRATIDQIKQILADCHAGNEEAFAKLQDIFLPVTYTLARRILGHLLLTPEQQTDIAAEGLRKAIAVCNPQNFTAGSFANLAELYIERAYKDYLSARSAPKPSALPVSNGRVVARDTKDLPKPSTPVRVNPRGKFKHVHPDDIPTRQIDLDEPLRSDEEDGATHGDMMADNSQNPERILFQREILRIWELVTDEADLTDDEYTILELTEGLNGHPRHSHEDVASRSAMLLKTPCTKNELRTRKMLALRKLIRAAKRLRARGVQLPEEM